MGYYGLNAFLLHFIGANTSTTFWDESRRPWTANGNAQISTAQSVFFGSSGYFDGTTDWINTPAGSLLNVSNKNFALELRIRPNAGGVTQYVCGQIDAAGTNNSASMAIKLVASGAVEGYVFSGGSAYAAATAAATYAANTWLALALVRYNDTLSIYADGVAGPTTANLAGVTVNSSVNDFSIGRLGEYNGLYYAGYVDEARLLNGFARWQANYTVPTYAYTFYHKYFSTRSPVITV